MLVVSRRLRDETSKGKTVNDTAFEEVVALRQRGVRCFPKRRVGDGAQLLDVRRYEEPAVVAVQRRSCVRKDVDADAWTHLIHRPREWSRMAVVSHTAPDLDLLDGRVRELCVPADVAAGQRGGGRGAGGSARRSGTEVLTAAGVLKQRPDLEFQLARGTHEVVRLEADGREIPRLPDVVRVGRIGKEEELRVVIHARCVREASVAREQSAEELATGRLMPPPEIQEAVHILLLVVEAGRLGRVEGHLEFRA